ncbi:MAG: hypothetical protein DK306_002276 [Chloroflexi bacterium]|nr:MAG: hypothetical protein DK306_002276 [Chloroflexota bacterium]
MPPLVPPFLIPKWLRDAPLPIKLALLAPGLLVGALGGIVVNAIMINIGAGNQHLSSADGGFDAWLIWIIVAAGLVLGLGAGAFVYFGVGLGADDFDDDDEHDGESGLLEV